jgi:transcriptional regulator with XRE-family HTH domain
MKFDTAELTRLREARGMTQRQLAAAIGVNQSAISRIERGDRDPLEASRVSRRRG